jgi:hypothetical protein
VSDDETPLDKILDLQTLQALGARAVFESFVACACGCYHPADRDALGRREVRFACPHVEHTIAVTDSTAEHGVRYATYTNPPHSGAIVG